jgi:hypothetical protein
MSANVRTRVLAPVLIPVAIVLVMGGFIGMVAALLLWNTKTGSLALATIAAAGILFAASMAASRDRLDARAKVVLGLAVLLPFGLGAGVAVGAIGDVPEEARMINVPPLITVPEDAPRLAAENSLEYCLPQEDGSCAPTRSWEVVPGEGLETIAFVFENRGAAVPHNIVITLLDGTPDAPRAGEVIAESTLITGVQDEYYVAETASWDDLPEQWYFFCRVHANMNGVGTVIAAG